jgi:U3 small nucleolar RNA-associated protein 18
MPRQRSKKLSAGREAAQKPILEPERESGQYESENDSPAIQEKDSDEEELDRLVFGDETEFKAQLGHGMVVDQPEGSGRSSGDESNREEEGGFENVDDADVSSITITR